MHLNALINWNWENPSLLQQTSDFNSTEKGEGKETYLNKPGR
jgi:hypothetical protein